jgi:hypothetical protein
MPSLSKDEIRRLREWADAHGGTDPCRIAQAMGTKEERGFRWKVLKRAMLGLDVSPANAQFIRSWIRRQCAEPDVLDQKRASAGEARE